MVDPRSEPELAAAGRAAAAHGRDAAAEGRSDAEEGRAVQAAAIAALAVQIDRLADSIREDRIWRRRFIASQALLLLLVIGLLWVAAENHSNGELIRDVVTPGGERYEDAQERQRETIGSLVDEIDRRAGLRHKQTADCLMGRGECP